LAIGLASSGFAAGKEAKAKRKAQEDEARVSAQEAKNEALFNKQYYQDTTKRSDMQNMLRLMEENQRNSEERASAQGATMGATDSQQLAEREGIRKSYADSMADLVSNAAQLKDAYMENYMNRASGLFDKKMEIGDRLSGIYANEASQMSQAGANLFSTGASLLGAGLGQTAGGTSKSESKPSYFGAFKPEPIKLK
jgi:hypothetical protein